MSTEKPVLFYSSHCSHSDELLQNMFKCNIKDKVEQVCVETAKSIPSFVDRVPLLYFDGKFLVDEELFNYIDSLKSTKEIEPFVVQEMGSGCGNISDAYSYLDEGESSSRPYFLSTDNVEHKINTPPEEDSKSDRNTMSLETLMMRRDQDIKK